MFRNVGALYTYWSLADFVTVKRPLSLGFAAAEIEKWLRRAERRK